MAYTFIFKIPQGNKQQYDAAVDKLKERGLANPVGRLYHFAGPMPGGWQVIDIWRSREEFDSFMKDHLSGIMRELGLPKPEIDMASADIILDNKTT